MSGQEKEVNADGVEKGRTWQRLFPVALQCLHNVDGLVCSNGSTGRDECCLVDEFVLEHSDAAK